MLLTWDDDGRGAHRAWSDQVCVGAVVLRGAGQYWFDATYAVRMREIPGSAPSCGEVATLDEGKAALEHAWSKWLTLAGLAK